MGGIGKFIFSKWGVLTGLLGFGAAYKRSERAMVENPDDPSSGAFKRGTDQFVSETAVPLVKDAAAGVTSLVSGAAGLAQEGAKEPPEVFEKGGEVVGGAVQAAKKSSESFLKGIVPKGWEGWATVGAALLGLTGLGASGLLGDTVKTGASKLLNVPWNLAGGVMGLTTSFLTPIAVVGGSLALGWLLLTPNGRQLMSDVFEGVKNLVVGGMKALEHESVRAPASALKPENVAPKKPAPQAQPQPQPESHDQSQTQPPNYAALDTQFKRSNLPDLSGVTGGIETKTVAKPGQDMAGITTKPGAPSFERIS